MSNTIIKTVTINLTEILFSYHHHPKHIDIQNDPDNKKGEQNDKQYNDTIIYTPYI
jgi:hypothetical protein